MASNKAPKSILYLDVLNIAATFCVVWLHFGNEVHFFDGSAAWYMCVPIQCIAYWAVPVFFMLSGAKLMNYRSRYSTKDYFQKRLLRTVWPYLVWGAIQMFVHKATLFPDGVSLGRVINSYITNSMEPIYWFFPAIFSVYLAMPVLSLLAEDENRRILNYSVGVGVFMISVLPFTYNFIHYAEAPESSGVYWNSLLTFPSLGGYTLYAVLGYWAATHSFSRIQRIACYLLGIVGLVFRWNGLITYSVRDGVTSGIFMDYLSWQAMVLSLAVFVAFRYVPWNKIFRGEVPKKIIKKASGCCLGVYVSHNLIINWMAPIAFFQKYSARWYYGWPIIVFGACLVAVWVLSGVPVLRYLFLPINNCALLHISQSSSQKQSWEKTIEHFKRYRPLLLELVSRDLKVKYRRSFLGYFWSLLNPLLMMTVMSFIFSYMFRFDINNYPLYLICGQTLWAFFNESTNSSMFSVIQNATLLKKVYIPKFIFPVSRVISCFVTMSFSLASILIVMLVTRAPIHWHLLLFPIPLVFLMLFSMGVSMILAALAVYFRDITHLYSVLTLVWMYATPIFYPIDSLPDSIAAIVSLNPLCHYITIFRELVLYGAFPPLAMWTVSCCSAVVTAIVGLVVFYKMQKDFILYL